VRGGGVIARGLNLAVLSSCASGSGDTEMAAVTPASASRLQEGRYGGDFGPATSEVPARSCTER
jgi:predicted alternative tryptophan synthase beta-subunit